MRLLVSYNEPIKIITTLWKNEAPRQWPKIEPGDFQMSTDGKTWHEITLSPLVLADGPSAGRAIQLCLSRDEAKSLPVIVRGRSMSGDWDDWIMTFVGRAA